MSGSSGKSRRTIPGPVLIFFASVVAGGVVSALVSQFISFTHAVTTLLTAFLVVFTVAVVTAVHHEISTHLAQSKLSAEVHYSLRTPDGDVPLYDPVSSRITSAKESIRVVGLYRSPDLLITPGRTKYYEAIHDLLETKHKQGRTFRYQRIIQVKEVTPGKLGADQTDHLTFEHCKHLLQLQEQKTALFINLWQIPDIVGSVSFIIIDDKEVVLAIPGIDRVETRELRASHLGTAMIFTDNDGALVKEMLNLFDALRDNADRVEEVQESDQRSVIFPRKSGYPNKRS